eukprot:TRINITY_DN627_c1_g1_i2.p1 TRINITY_DN627_c1_g1~~TRINITY_DN627_c1_g1_i2.p1  ORF type:complete len:473 (+),score=46.73 TRINITY_DN627_c1_g1_i2:125-1543(+)
MPHLQPSMELLSWHNMSEAVPPILLVVTGFAFLAPAVTAIRLGRLWLASVFTLMSAICAAYHICDADLPDIMGLRRSCPASVTHVLTLADHGSAYFCILQLAFLLLGPEDPSLQDGAESPKISTMVMTRLLPATSIVALLAFLTSWSEFHWLCILLCEGLLLSGFFAFWLRPGQRSVATKVLLRRHFWLRALKHGLIPVFVASCLFICMNISGISIAHSIWHVVLSVLAVRIIHAVIADGPKMQHLLSLDVLASQQCGNPVVAHQLLMLPALIGIPTLLASGMLDFSAEQHWRWPLLTMPLNHLPGGYVTAIGALPTLAALGAAFGLIGGYGPHDIFAIKELNLKNHIGCLIGYLAVGLGYLAVFARFGDGIWKAQSFWMITSLFFFSLAVYLPSIGPTPQSKSKRMLAATISAFLTVLVMMLSLEEKYIPNNFLISQPVLAIFEYISLGLLLLWPCSWISEVEAKWMTLKC